jgi:hypothetical protein
VYETLPQELAREVEERFHYVLDFDKLHATKPVN